MERLTYRDARGEAWYADSGTEADHPHFIADIEDILGDNYDLDRLREIVQADREGRCVVMPCKVGDTVFQVEDGEIYEMEVQSIEIDSSDPNDMSIFTDELTLEKRDFHEDVYRTEREAKAALKGEPDA